MCAVLLFSIASLMELLLLAVSSKLSDLINWCVSIIYKTPVTLAAVCLFGGSLGISHTF